MTRFVHGSKSTWALVLWSGYIATWMAVTGSGPAIVAVWWLAGLAVVQLVPRSLARNNGLSATPEAIGGPIPHQRDAVEDWESEGGAIAGPSRATTPAPRAA